MAGQVQGARTAPPVPAAATGLTACTVHTPTHHLAMRSPDRPPDTNRPQVTQTITLSTGKLTATLTVRMTREPSDDCADAPTGVLPTALLIRFQSIRCTTPTASRSSSPPPSTPVRPPVASPPHLAFDPAPGSDIHETLLPGTRSCSRRLLRQGAPRGDGRGPQRSQGESAARSFPVMAR